MKQIPVLKATVTVGAIISPPWTELNSVISPPQTDTNFNISPAMNSFSRYVQPPNSGHMYWLRPYVSVHRAAPEQLPDLSCSITNREFGQATS